MKWTTEVPTAKGWYWWRGDTAYEMPAYLGDGPFGNDAFKPGKGWLLANKMGGEWWPEKIEPPEDTG